MGFFDQTPGPMTDASGVLGVDPQIINSSSDPSQDPLAALYADLKNAHMTDHQIMQTMLAQGIAPQDILKVVGGGVASADATAGIMNPSPAPADDASIATPAPASPDLGDSGISPAGTPDVRPPTSVADAIHRATSPGTLLAAEDASAAPADPTPDVSVVGADIPGMKPPGSNALVPDQGTFAKILGLASPDTPFGQGLMAAGFGMMGARGTYGNVGAAVGQGGLLGVGAYQKALEDQTKKDEAAAKNKLEMNAQDMKRAENKVTLMQTLAKNGQYDAANKIAKDPDVRKLLTTVGDLNLTKPPEKPVTHFSDATGQATVLQPDTLKYTTVKAFDPAPREPRAEPAGHLVPLKNTPGAPYYNPKLPDNADIMVLFNSTGSLATTLGLKGSEGAQSAGPIKEMVNTKEASYYDPARPEGASVQVQFYNDGSTPKILGMAPDKNLHVHTDPSGGTDITVGAEPNPSTKAVDTSRDTINNGNVIHQLIDSSHDVMRQSNIGNVGKLQGLAYGALATIKGNPLAAHMQDTVESARKLTNAQLDPALFENDASAIKVYQEALALRLATFGMTSGRNMKEAMASARRQLGTDDQYPSMPDVLARMRTVGDYVRKIQEQSQETMKANHATAIPDVVDAAYMHLGKPNPVATPSGGGTQGGRVLTPTPRPSYDDFMKSLPGNMSQEEKFTAAARQGY